MTDDQEWFAESILMIQAKLRIKYPKIILEYKMLTGARLFLPYFIISLHIGNFFIIIWGYLKEGTDLMHPIKLTLSVFQVDLVLVLVNQTRCHFQELLNIEKLDREFPDSVHLMISDDF